MPLIGTQAEQRAFLRRSVGHQQDTALVTDDLLDDCLKDSLREVNLTFPLVGVGFFETVADQQKYDNVLPAGSYRLRRAFWPNESTQSLPDSFPVHLDPIVEAGTQYYSSKYTFSPAATLAMERHSEYLKRWFEGGAKIFLPGTGYLMPVPSEAGKKVYFTFSSPRFAGPADVLDQYGPAYFAWAKKCLHEALAAGRGAVESITSPAGVTMRTGARSSHLELANREHKRWLDLIPPIATARSWP